MKNLNIKVFSWEQIVAGLFPLEWKTKGCAITVGSFDGMHRGHVALVEALKVKQNLVPGIVTFKSSYRSYDGSSRGDVCSLNQKIKYADNLCLSFAIVIDFSSDFARMEGLSFMDALVDFCGMKFLSEGLDFRCGYKGALDMKGLESYALQRNIELRKVDDVLFEDMRVSSSRIREVIYKGDFLSAQKMLGRSYSYDCRENLVKIFDTDSMDFVRSFGVAVKGSQILPASGTYKVTVVCEGSLTFEADCTILETNDACPGFLNFFLPKGILKRFESMRPKEIVFM